MDVSINLPLSQSVAFDVFVAELVTALAQRGLTFEAMAHGRVTEGEHEVAHVVSWQQGEEFRLAWSAADWTATAMPELAVRFEPFASGTRVTIEHPGWGNLLSDPSELTGWFAGTVAAPLLVASAPASLADWLTDRGARRPSGARARDVYRDPLYHYPNFRVILAELALTPEDLLLEVGCGGGKLLQEALNSGCRAAAVDHSVDMVRLAREVNAEAIAQDRLEIRLAEAEHLPFPDGMFTCAAMTGVFGFLPDPVAALREIWRVLAPGGRLVVLGSDPALRGTPAAPEPMASRLHFYDDDEHQRLALAAGFDRATVVRRDLEPFARQVGVPEEHLALFAGPGTPFLLAYRD